MKKYRKKPVVIEALQITENTRFDDIKDFTGAYSSIQINGVYLKTLEGTMHASIGDWIIKGVQGEFYPCKPDIFEATYEEVTDEENA